MGEMSALKKRREGIVGEREENAQQAKKRWKEGTNFCKLGLTGL
jgi:hypothetical protein